MTATPQKRTLLAACLAHATHDGLSDLVYVLLPIWQQQFALGFALLSLLRSAYALTLAAVQVPAATLASRMRRPERLLIGATLLTALGWWATSLAPTALLLGAALVVCGLGASTQHPIASAMVSRAYGKAAKRPLGLYNFAGDLGKSVLPAGAAVLLAHGSYGATVSLYAAIAVLAALLMAWLLRGRAPVSDDPTALARARPAAVGVPNPGAFRALLTLGALDSAVRMGLLTFLPFILQANGATLPQTGLGLTLVFIGGAIGKFLCGWLGDRLGLIRTVLVTELATALLIGAVMWAPLAADMALLPLLGAMLNGTSSVLYGEVPEVVSGSRLEKAFAVFYTGTIGAGAVSPVLYGHAGDVWGIGCATLLVAGTAVCTVVPLAWFSSAVKVRQRA